ncbi:hypothetical protein F5X68DRAFT_265818 [Plectosphaerella plurivora]|uniref:CFEM domain-containing protein n=1 Tax=Plectosphaerella plurivora TaxID=936078 RepID=A0A9P8V1Z9_9PEZI|nr:hypothetical protein F5X68DRAFT_265818 [Plectosphaerella plurivora]
MKFSVSTWAAVASTLVTMASPAAAVPVCALTCFSDVITEYPPLSCTEANMFLCFCKSPFLAVTFHECVCEKCATPALAEEAIAFGLDTCVEYAAPIDWLPTTCVA